MKTLILILLTTFGSAKTIAQTIVVANAPVILKAPQKTTWQVSQAIDFGEFFLLAGQNKSHQSENKMLLIATDKDAEAKWVKELPYPPAISLAACTDRSIVMLNASKSEALLTRLNPVQGNIIWQIPLKREAGGYLATQKDGYIAVATDTEDFIQVRQFSAEGTRLWETQLPKQHKGKQTLSKIIGLKDGTYAIIGGGKIWGIDSFGHISWQFGSETEQIKWQSIKQLKNGETVAVGFGVSQSLGSKNTNIYVWGIAGDGSKIAWATITGEEETHEKAYDFIENPNGDLILLCQKDNNNELVKLNAEHQAKVIYTTENNLNQQFRFLFSGQNGNFTAIGNSWNEEGKQIVTQVFEQKISPPSAKPNLFLLSIGVGDQLRFTRNDAFAISEIYQQQAGKWFNKTHVETFTADSATKAGELAKAFELLSTKDIQSQDMVIVYFSGFGLATDDDYLLLGSDYNPSALRSTSVRMSQLLRDLDNLPGRKLILLDACYSGAAIKLPGDISIMTASTARQAAYEDPEWQHGAFTRVFLEAMKSRSADVNADNYTTLLELFDYTKKNLPLLTQQKHVQNPVLLHKGDDFVLFEK
jgi:hypothetical protein